MSASSHPARPRRPRCKKENQRRGQEDAHENSELDGGGVSLRGSCASPELSKSDGDSELGIALATEGDAPEDEDDA